jgi:Fe2+ or Zn2+ uptake regulation protein
MIDPHVDGKTHYIICDQCGRVAECQGVNGFVRVTEGWYTDGHRLTCGAICSMLLAQGEPRPR